MKKCVFLNQLIATMLFTQLSCAMDPACKFETESDRFQERVDLILGFITLYKNYKEVQCEEVLFFRKSRQNRQTINEGMPISDTLRVCFKDNLPFTSTDEEILRALLLCKKMDTPFMRIDDLMKVRPAQK